MAIRVFYEAWGGRIHVSVEGFQKCVAHISKNVKDSDGMIHQTYLVPTEPSSPKSINDSSYLPGDRL